MAAAATSVADKNSSPVLTLASMVKLNGYGLGKKGEEIRRRKSIPIDQMCRGHTLAAARSSNGRTLHSLDLEAHYIILNRSKAAMDLRLFNCILAIIQPVRLASSRRRGKLAELTKQRLSGTQLAEG